jgi:hypothetical protein
MPPKMSGGQGFLVEKPPQLEDASRESVEKFIAARKKYVYAAGALVASAKMGTSQAVLSTLEIMGVDNTLEESEWLDAVAAQFAPSSGIVTFREFAQIQAMRAPASAAEVLDLTAEYVVAWSSKLQICNKSLAGMDMQKLSKLFVAGLAQPLRSAVDYHNLKGKTLDEVMKMTFDEAKTIRTSVEHIGALSFGLAGASTSGYGDGKTRQEQIDNCEW